MSFQKTIRHNTMKEKVLLFEMGQYEQRGLIQNCFPVEHKFTGFKITLISFSYVCLPFYLVFRTCYRWLFSDHQFFPLGDSFCPRLPSFHPSQYISSSSLALAVNCTNNPISRQSLTRQSLAAMVSGCISQGLLAEEPPSDKSESWLFPTFCIKTKECIF